MLCCVGLFAGLSIGQSMGGPWTYIAPAAGFGIGFLADMKFMKGMHSTAGHERAGAAAKNDANSVRNVEMDGLKAPPANRSRGNTEASSAEAGGVADPIQRFHLTS